MEGQWKDSLQRQRRHGHISFFLSVEEFMVSIYTYRYACTYVLRFDSRTNSQRMTLSRGGRCNDEAEDANWPLRTVTLAFLLFFLLDLISRFSRLRIFEPSCR